MSEEMTEKKTRKPSVETIVKMLRKHVVQVNGLVAELKQSHDVDVDVTLDPEDNEIILGEIKLVKTL